MFSYGFKHSIDIKNNKIDIIENKDYHLFINSESFSLQYKILKKK